jgi:uncharacterized protein (TIGR03083 family)
METFDAYVPIVHTEADGLAQFLDTLSADEWQRPSACELWTIHDVVAHLVWAADFYTDTVSRGMQGDISRPADRPPGDAPDAAAMPAYFHQHTLRVRDRVGAALLPTFRASYGALCNLMGGLSPQQWAMPCAFFQHFGGTLPAQAFLLLIIQELVIHGWDIRSRFVAAATLTAASLPPLMERIRTRFGLPGFATFPIDAARWPMVRYQFALGAEKAHSYDVIVEGGKARMEPSRPGSADVTLRCDQATFALMMYKRLTLDPAVAQGRVTVEGNPALVAVLDQWLKHP